MTDLTPARLREIAALASSSGHLSLEVSLARALLAEKEKSDAARPQQGPLYQPVLRTFKAHPDEPLSTKERDLCEGCPPVGYPTDATRCLPCPRRAASAAPDHNPDVRKMVSGAETEGEKDG